MWSETIMTLALSSILRSSSAMTREYCPEQAESWSKGCGTYPDGKKGKESLEEEPNGLATVVE